MASRFNRFAKKELIEYFKFNLMFILGDRFLLGTDTEKAIYCGLQ